MAQWSNPLALYSLEIRGLWFESFTKLLHRPLLMCWTWRRIIKYEWQWWLLCARMVQWIESDANNLEVQSSSLPSRNMFCVRRHECNRAGTQEPTQWREKRKRKKDSCLNTLLEIGTQASKLDFNPAELWNSVIWLILSNFLLYTKSCEFQFILWMKNFCSSKQVKCIKQRLFPECQEEKGNLTEKSGSPAGFKKKYGFENSSVQLTDHQQTDFSIVSN